MTTKKYQPFVPEKCWVGDQQKICYKTRDEAEIAAKVAAFDYNAPELSVNKCEFGDHWHLSSKKLTKSLREFLPKLFSKDLD